MNTMLPSLTPSFWDCECAENYIHHHAIPVCPRCGVAAAAQPDSHPEEVAQLLVPIFAELLVYFAQAVEDLREIERLYQVNTNFQQHPVSQPPPWLTEALQSLQETPEDQWLEADWEDRIAGLGDSTW